MTFDVQEPHGHAVQEWMATEAEYAKVYAAVAETAVRLADAGYYGNLVESVTRLLTDLAAERESRFRWAEEAAEMAAQRDSMGLLAAGAVEQSVGTGTPVVVLPENFGAQIYEAFHGIRHPGAKASDQLAAVIRLVESWRPPAVEGPHRAPVAADEAHYIAQRLALDEVAAHAEALGVERDRLLWLHAEARWHLGLAEEERLRLVAELENATITLTGVIVDRDRYFTAWHSAASRAAVASQATAAPSPSDLQAPPRLGVTETVPLSVRKQDGVRDSSREAGRPEPTDAYVCKCPGSGTHAHVRGCDHHPEGGQP